MRENTRAAEKAGEHYVASGRIRSAGGKQVGRDDTQQGAQLEDVPAFASENRDRGAFIRERVAFPSDGLDQGGLAAAVRAKDADMLTGCHEEADVLQCRVLSPHYDDVLQVQKRGPAWAVGHDVSRYVLNSLVRLARK